MRWVDMLTSQKEPEKEPEEAAADVIAKIKRATKHGHI